MSEKQNDKETKEFENRLDGCIAAVWAAIHGCWILVFAAIVIVATVLVILL